MPSLSVPCVPPVSRCAQGSSHTGRLVSTNRVASTSRGGAVGNVGEVEMRGRVGSVRLVHGHQHHRGANREASTRWVCRGACSVDPRLRQLRRAGHRWWTGGHGRRRRGRPPRGRHRAGGAIQPLGRPVDRRSRVVDRSDDRLGWEPPGGRRRRGAHRPVRPGRNARTEPRDLGIEEPRRSRLLACPYGGVAGHRALVAHRGSRSAEARHQRHRPRVERAHAHALLGGGSDRARQLRRGSDLREQARTVRAHGARRHRLHR